MPKTITMNVRLNLDMRSVNDEIERAMMKFPTWPTDPIHAAAVISEESGEVMKAVLQAVYEPHKSGPSHVREEVIQTAAMCIRFLASLDDARYDWTPVKQHTQEMHRGA